MMYTSEKQYRVPVILSFSKIIQLKIFDCCTSENFVEVANILEILVWFGRKENEECRNG